MHLGRLFVCLSVHSLFLITLTLGVEREGNAFGSVCLSVCLSTVYFSLPSHSEWSARVMHLGLFVCLSVCPQFISHYPHTRSGAQG